MGALFFDVHRVSLDVPELQKFLRYDVAPISEQDSRIVSLWSLTRWLTLVNPRSALITASAESHPATLKNAAEMRRHRLHQWAENAQAHTKVLRLMGSLLFQSTGLWTHLYPRGWEGAYQNEKGRHSFVVAFRFLQVLVALCTTFLGMVACGTVAAWIFTQENLNEEITSSSADKIDSENDFFDNTFDDIFQRDKIPLRGLSLSQ